jgi:hypothetical protein
MHEIKKWYRTLELAAHCLCEQGYDASNLIEIALHIEKTSGIKPNPTVPAIKQTIRFHENYEMEKRKELNLRHKEERLMEKREKKFQTLSGAAQSEIVRENSGSYWKAVEAYAARKRRK